MPGALRWTAVVVVALWTSSRASAQEREAESALREADAARVAGDVDRAVDLYRLALDADEAAGFGIAVVESGRSLGITEAALAGLRALTPEAAQVFRTRYDQRATAALEEARAAADPSRALARVYERYPIASVAPQVLEAMADVAIARGQRERARVTLGLLLEHHAKEVDEPRVRAKLAGYAPPRGAAAAPTIGEARFDAKTFDPTASASASRSTPPGLPSASSSARHLPLVLGDHVFVVRADQVLTYDVRSGEDAKRIPRIGPPYDDANPKVLFGAAVDGSMLVVSLVDQIRRDQQFRGIPIKVKIPLRKLAGFDVERWTWTWNHARLLEGTPMAAWSFSSPPVAFDGAVLAPAFVSEHPLIGSYVASFDARTGEHQWDRRVGAGEFEQTTFGEQATEPLCTPLAVSDGIVYHSTSFGAVAALDATSGRPLWTSAYEVIEVRAPRGYYSDPRTIGWESNAPVVQSGVVVVAPMDSPRLYGFDARTGRQLWSNRQRATAAEGELRFIMGAAEVDGQGVVVLAGESSVRCLDVRTGELRWDAPLRGRTVAGRGCVQGGTVLVPLDRNEVQSLDLATGKRGASFPVGTSGNVTFAGEHVLVTGNGALAVHAAGP